MDNGHSVFAFKSMLLLQTLLQFGGRPWVNRFVKAAGISVLVPLMVASLAKVRHRDSSGALESRHSDVGPEYL